MGEEVRGREEEEEEEGSEEGVSESEGDGFPIFSTKIKGLGRLK